MLSPTQSLVVFPQRLPAAAAEKEPPFPTGGMDFLAIAAWTPSETIAAFVATTSNTRGRTAVRKLPDPGLSLIELMAALTIVAVVAAVALPLYDGYRVRAHRAQAQADLLRCAQGMESHASATGGYALAVDTDGDGAGDASTGAVSANICSVSAPHEVVLSQADTGGFVLRATPPPAAGRLSQDGRLETDAIGGRRWDRNNDGDFDDADEWSWRP